jgi:hypothetical protein
MRVGRFMGHHKKQKTKTPIKTTDQTQALALTD